MDAGSRRSSARPPVAVVVPFRGDADAARWVLEALAELALDPGDEVIVADNSDGLHLQTVAAGSDGIRVVAAAGERSSYHARNVAADAARAEWLLFLDADCKPPRELIARYFARGIPSDHGLVAGGVEGVAEQDSLVARWSRSRRVLDPIRLSGLNPRPFGATANLLVRRAAWEGVGGFQEGIRSGGDAEFCWRVQDAGWTLGFAPEAVVEHFDREGIPARARVAARYGAGRAWLNRHRPGSTPRPRLLRPLLRSIAAAPVLAIAGRIERARFKLVDAVEVAFTAAGYLCSNRPRAARSTAPARGLPVTALLCNSFPVLTETFIAAEAQALRALGMPLRIEAVHRPERPNRAAAQGLDVAYVEDEGYLRRIVSLLALAVRHPLRFAADVFGSRRWPKGERVPLVSMAPMIRRLEGLGTRHLHVHFATAAAVTAARIARFLGITYSVTAHAHEIFRSPTALRLKLLGAAFVTTGCEYNRRHLREKVVDGHVPVHEIVMGTDLEAFRRRRPYPGTRRVIAVGRLVPKKGFDTLVEAAALLEGEHPLDEVAIVGDGTERDRLAAMIAERSLEHRVRLLGALEPERIRSELERSDLLAMPSVIAPDGDRDSMPVVVKEALAMEVPVVASDEVGLPELVQPSFGRLVPPGDAHALAKAIAELLALSPRERAEMGARGRAWIAAHANVERESEKLTRLIASAI